MPSATGCTEFSAGTIGHVTHKTPLIRNWSSSNFTYNACRKPTVAGSLLRLESTARAYW